MDTTTEKARLYDAAPELLAVVKLFVAIDGDIRRSVCDWCGHHPTKHAEGCLVRQAKDAIAKAEGKP